MVVDNLKGNVFVNQYLIIKDLGRGAHGSVKLCLDTQDGEVYAMKVVQKKGPNRRRASYSIPTTPMTPRGASPDVWTSPAQRTSPLMTSSSNAGSLAASLNNNNTGGGTPLQRSLHFANAAAAAAASAAAAAAAGAGGCETPSLGASRVTPGWPVTGVSMALMDSSPQATPTATTPTTAAAAAAAAAAGGGGDGAGASFGSTLTLAGSPVEVTAAAAEGGSFGSNLNLSTMGATAAGREQQQQQRAGGGPNALDSLLPAPKFSSSSGAPAAPTAAAAAAAVEPGGINLEGAWAVAQRSSSSTGMVRQPSSTPPLTNLPSNVVAALAGLSSVPFTSGSGSSSGGSSNKQVAAALQGLSTSAAGEPLSNSSSSMSAGNVAAALAGLSTAAAAPTAAAVAGPEVCLPPVLTHPQPALALPPGLFSGASTCHWTASPGSASGCHTPSAAAAAAGGGGGFMAADAATEQLMREMAVMKKLDHPNVVKLYEVIHDPEQRLLVMVMEYMPCGSVLQPATAGAGGRTQPLKEATARRYFRDVLQGLDYLHYNHIMHGDLKPENLLLSLDDVVKISDFGSCSTLHPAATISSTLGTPAFMAPEMCQVPTQRFRPFVAEMWALGVCLYMFLFGRVPYEAGSSMKLYELIRSPDPIQLPSEASALSSELRGLLLGLLDKNPDQRLTLPQVFDHPWVTQQGAQLLHSCEELCGADNSQLATAVRVMASGREQNQALTSWGKQMKAALPSMEERAYKKKQVLVREGEVPEGMFLILKGKVELVHGAATGAGGKKARKEGDADFASAMSDEASSSESEESDSEEEEEEEGDSASVSSSGNWAIKAAAAGSSSGSFSPMWLRLRPPQQQQMLARQVGGGTGSSTPAHPPSGASSPAPATPTAAAAGGASGAAQQGSAARSSTSSHPSRRTSGASWWGLWEAAAAASLPRRRRTDPKEHPAPLEQGAGHLQQTPSMPTRPSSSNKRRTASMDYQHYAALQAQRSVCSFTGAQASPAQQLLVQRSAASATVMARAVRRSESMHIRMKQLVEVAKARTTQQRGGEDLVVTRGPGQVVGDTSMGTTRSPATATVRAKTKVKVLLVRPQDMGILRAQPQVKAALARTQTESNILDVLESFASYDEEVTAIDELRKVLATNGSLSLPNGHTLATGHSRQGSFSMTGGASLLLAPGPQQRAGSPMGPNGGASNTSLGVFREGSFSTAALSRQGSGVLRPGVINMSAAVLGGAAAASSGLASPRRNGGLSPARTNSNVRMGPSSGSPPLAATASIKRALSIGTKRASMDAGARSHLSREASSSNLAGMAGAGDAPGSPRGGPTSPRGFAAAGPPPWLSLAAEGGAGEGGAGGGLRSPRQTGGLAATGSSHRGAWAFHTASSSSSRSFTDRPGSPDLPGGAAGAGGGVDSSPSGSFTAAGGLVRQASHLSHSSSISPTPSVSAPVSPEPGQRPDSLGVVSGGAAAGGVGSSSGPQQQQQQQQQMLSHGRIPSRSSTRSKTRLRSGISWTELGAAAAGGVTGPGVGHTWAPTAEAMQQLRASFQMPSPREQP